MNELQRSTPSPSARVLVAPDRLGQQSVQGSSRAHDRVSNRAPYLARVQLKGEVASRVMVVSARAQYTDKSVCSEEAENNDTVEEAVDETTTAKKVADDEAAAAKKVADDEATAAKKMADDEAAAAKSEKDEIVQRLQSALEEVEHLKERIHLL